LIPTDQCNDVQTLRPNECRRCGAKLAGSDPEPLRHQVWELPEIEPLVAMAFLDRIVDGAILLRFAVNRTAPKADPKHLTDVTAANNPPKNDVEAGATKASRCAQGKRQPS
jgi:hypothetical protein